MIGWYMEPLSHCCFHQEGQKQQADMARPLWRAKTCECGVSLGATTGRTKQREPCQLAGWISGTPWKFNIAPQKWWLEDYFPIGKIILAIYHFLLSCCFEVILRMARMRSCTHGMVLKAASLELQNNSTGKNANCWWLNSSTSWWIVYPISCSVFSSPFAGVGY